MSINTILFDLDGTLLPMDSDLFMKIYFDEMAKDFEDLIEKEKLIKYIWIATKEMVNNIEPRTNESVFMEKFGQLIDGQLDTYVQRFNNYYDQGFSNVKSAVMPEDWILKSVNLLKSKGYELVVATNPLFPKKAILHRIRWAGLDPKMFSYITCYEQNHYCKPQLKYFQEILEAVGKNPTECLMVGNDVQEDLVSGQLGLKTYLLGRHIINRTEDAPICDYKGDYKDFYKFAESLKDLNKSF
jgi:HAD superfamily hydrolase (TIGR01549 family)